MIPEIALIRTDYSYKYNKKICGLYPLERNIIILSKAGVKKIFLDLSKEEMFFYKKRIIRHLKHLNTEIIFQKDNNIQLSYISISSNLFTQIHYFNEFGKYFNKKNEEFISIINDEQFLLMSHEDYKNAVYQTRKYIIQNTGGFISQKINKRLSIPVSLLLVNTRIHPNYLTVLNMIVGLMSGVFLLFNSYWRIVLGGFLFQLASIMDGVDGEVAKITFKVSKIGGWLDTISDNLTLLFFLFASAYLYYINTGGLLSLSVIVIAFAGLVIMITAMVRFLKQYSESGSLVAYDREFLHKLPKDDPFVFVAQRLKYITKKEFFSIAFFAICLTGRAHFIIPAFAFVLFIASIILVILDFKYMKNFIKEKRGDSPDF